MSHEASPSMPETEDLIDLEQVSLFDAIDRLGRLSLAGNIEYPQLVVVGDQSSGKSSVLEAVARFHFPVSEGLCTRFPMKLILRRSERLVERVFIEPGPSRTAQERPMLTQFGGAITDSHPLDEWMRRASVALGVMQSVDNGAGSSVPSHNTRQFTDDTLVIEKHGPDLPIVNLVDLPGIFQVVEEDVQDEASRDMVSQMVQGYVRSQGNLILLVTTARSSIYNLSVVRMMQTISEEDPGLVDRIVGVITNPDHAVSINETLRLLRGHSSSDVLRCKWHVVRNQDSAERSTETLAQRDRTEAEFFVKNWQDVRARIESIDHRLTDLDSSRLTDLSRRRLLVRIATKFQDLTYKACSGVYENDACKMLHAVGTACRKCEPFFPPFESQDAKDQGKKLRSNIRALNKAFTTAMLTNGKAKEIVGSNTRPKDDDDSSASRSDADVKCTTTAVINKHYTQPKPEPVNLPDFERWVASWIPNWSAKEPTGEASEAAYHRLFEYQSQKWRLVSGQHLDAIWDATQRFVDLALAAACPDPDLRSALEQRLINPALKDLEMKSHRSVNDLLYCHAQGGTGFYDAKLDAKAARVKRVVGSSADVAGNHKVPGVLDKLPDVIAKAVFQNLMSQPSPLGSALLDPVQDLVFRTVQGAIRAGTKVPGENGSATASGTHPHRAKDTTARRVIRHVEANYETSLVSFVGYINALVVESGILRELPTVIFTPIIVMLQNDDMINSIAGEKEGDAKRRERDQRDLEELRAVMETLEHHVMRRI
ncbi:P-loop containing nucleoside triphosphate hydrolase protein [Podospora aff. communis PSN243]|uniref:P-loop containing nucleoside triphosphate hydrolase protein n=1 Tax=Podospora aff. communis PSN243 TaxID=3040156 RepID=A0AAV9FYX0_9PEZI|nr:P-loop containing nucleoside triphosphate hydrolase protein [Podospora aff. communis PSN243]